MSRIWHWTWPRLLPGRQVVEIEDPEQIGVDLDQHAFAKSCGLNGAHKARLWGFSELFILTRASPATRRRKTALVSLGMPWDPMRDLLTMQERLESLFGRTMPGWVPPVDLSELPDRYRLTVELPGLSRDDVHLDFLDGTLTIRGQRPGQTCCPERYQQLERGQGQFSRSFRFATAVDSEAISADLADGVLTVLVPKAAIPDRRIEIG